MSSNERFRQYNTPINKISSVGFSFKDQKKIRKELFISLLDANGF